MLVTIDKRGSVSLPAAIRRELGLKVGTNLELTVEDGGTIALNPVAIYRTVRLNDAGLSKLQEARDSRAGRFPDWFTEDMKDAETHPEQEIP